MQFESETSWYILKGSIVKIIHNHVSIHLITAETLEYWKKLSQEAEVKKPSLKVNKDASQPKTSGHIQGLEQFQKYTSMYYSWIPWGFSSFGGSGIVTMSWSFRGLSLICRMGKIMPSPNEETTLGISSAGPIILYSFAHSLHVWYDFINPTLPQKCEEKHFC